MTWLAAVAALICATAPASAAPALAALAPADDARTVLAIGPSGEVYAPDASGDWVRSHAFGTAGRLELAARAGGAVVALGGGVVYRLADNGWSAIRLVQKGQADMSSGSHAVAAVGRQLFALDRTVGGEPAKLALAPAPVLGIGSGAKTVVILTERGALRLEGAVFKPIARAPRRITRLISDRWAQTDRGIADLRGTTTLSWPAGLLVEVATTGSDDGLVAVGTTRAGIELLTIAAGKLVRDPIAGTSGARPVGVVLDKAGRAAVALRDGRIARRDRGTWTLSTVRDALPAPRPGAPPARSP